MMKNPSPLEVCLFPCLSDNYGFLIHDAAQDLTATVDTPEVNPIMQALEEKGWKLTHILNTHHHWDHAGGNLEIRKLTGCTIVGPAGEAGSIPGIDIRLADGDLFEFGEHKARIHETPGHTAGHIVYHFEEDHIAFVGDTLFAMGCGRLFEGTPGQMWSSLQKILQWPDDTKIYCAHEYTLKNGEFSLTVEPQNQVLLDRVEKVRKLRSNNTPTIPTELGLEKQTNPFLRPDSKDLRTTIGLESADDVTVFAKVRTLKDRF